MHLSPHFSLQEFTASETARARGLDNRMPASLRPAAVALCENVLEPLRAALGRPVLITSGYRAPLVNRAVGGAVSSQHTRGEAADIRVPGLTTAEVFEALRRLALPFDQAIDEFGAWVHVSHRCACGAGARPNRHQALLARTEGGRTVFSAAPPLLRPPPLP